MLHPSVRTAIQKLGFSAARVLAIALAVQQIQRGIPNPSALDGRRAVGIHFRSGLPVRGRGDHRPPATPELSMLHGLTTACPSSPSSPDSGTHAPCASAASRYSSWPGALTCRASTGSSPTLVSKSWRIRPKPTRYDSTSPGPRPGCVLHSLAARDSFRCLPAGAGRVVRKAQRRVDELKLLPTPPPHRVTDRPAPRRR